jgi:hypothetical protein
MAMTIPGSIARLGHGRMQQFGGPLAGQDLVRMPAA